MKLRWYELINDGKNSVYALVFGFLNFLISLFHDLLAPRPYSSIIAVVSFMIMTASIILSFMIGKKTRNIDTKNSKMGMIGFIISLCALIFSGLMLLFLLVIGLG